jgi:hypothetical protein
MRDLGHSLKSNRPPRLFEKIERPERSLNLGTVLPDACWKGIAETSTKEAAN